MEFLFDCSLRSLVRYRVEHEKRNSRFYHYRSVCHYYREVRNSDYSPSWQFSCPSSLVSNPKWPLRDKGLWIVVYPLNSTIQLLNNWGRVYSARCAEESGVKVCSL